MMMPQHQNKMILVVCSQLFESFVAEVEHPMWDEEGNYADSLRRLRRLPDQPRKGYSSCEEEKSVASPPPRPHYGLIPFFLDCGAMFVH